MKNYLIIGIILLFPFRLFADEPVKAIYAKITNPDNKEVTVVAHRADWRFAPENSLAAIESSIRCRVYTGFYPDTPSEEWRCFENQTPCAYIGGSIIDSQRARYGKFG